MSETVDLYIETDETTYQSGDEAAVRVSDGDGVPVAGASVRTPEGTTAVTDASGEAAVPLRRTGVVRIAARKEADDDDVEYVPATVAVTVEG